MLNAMVDDALRAHGSPCRTAKGVYRPILALKDLCRAIETMIEAPVTGVHDLCSFSGTVA